MITSVITYGSFHAYFELLVLIKHNENDFCHLIMQIKRFS